MGLVYSAGQVGSGRVSRVGSNQAGSGRARWGQARVGHTADGDRVVHVDGVPPHAVRPHRGVLQPEGAALVRGVHDVAEWVGRGEEGGVAAGVHAVPLDDGGKGFLWHPWGSKMVAKKLLA